MEDRCTAFNKVDEKINHHKLEFEEEQVSKIVEEQFPGRKMIFIDATMQNWSGGGIHCSTQQQPKRKS